MNAKNGGIIGIMIAIIIGIGITYVSSDPSVNQLESNNQPITNVTSDSLSNPTISDDAIINAENQNYIIDKDGKHHYTLVAKTEPVVSP